MTFYEELGVPPDAPLETIRDAYRNVARLLHPDLQTDPVLKESAEAQMKRINHLYGILSDPVRRRRYDQELAQPVERPVPFYVQASPPADQFPRGNNGALVWLAATAVCASFIIWLATRESSSSPAVYPLPAQPTSRQAPRPPLRPGHGSDRKYRQLFRPPQPIRQARLAAGSGTMNLRRCADNCSRPIQTGSGSRSNSLPGTPKRRQPTRRI